jgi:hypothetical protein
MPTVVARHVVRKRGDQWCVVAEDNPDKVFGCHDTREEAEAQLRAIEANKHAADGTYEIRDVEIFAAGTHNGDEYTVRDLDEMVRASREVGFTPPLKAGHAEVPGAPALGWVERLRRVGTKLVADFVGLPKAVYDAIRKRRYDRVSAEIYWDYERDGRTWGRVLKAVALLGAEIPAVPELRPLHEVVHTAYGQVRSYTTSLREVGPMRITVEQMEQICKPCAERMRRKNFKWVNIERRADGTYAIPGGMPEEAFRALCEKWGPDEGFRTRCMDSGVAAAVDDVGAFCNALESACRDAGLLSERRPAVAYQAEELRVEQVEGQWCVMRGDERLSCHDTEEAAREALEQAIQEESAAMKQQATTPQAATQATHTAAEQRIREYEAQLVATREALRQLQEERRRERVESKTAALKLPRLRAYVRALYDVATVVETKVKVYREQQGEEMSAEAVVDALVKELNDVAAPLFRQYATVPERPETSLDAGTDAAAEVDRRVRAYMAERNLRDYAQALRAVLDADAALKQRYTLGQQ